MFDKRSLTLTDTSYAEAHAALRELGVSVRQWSDGSLTALIRLGYPGLRDRTAIDQVEMRLGSTTPELIRWLSMCWQLPAHSEAPSI